MVNGVSKNATLTIILSELQMNELQRLLFPFDVVVDRV
jgi:hypothetical protein